MEYSVNYWGSHPSEKNDDCFTGEDFESLDQATVEYNKPCDDTDIQWIELRGPGVYSLRRNLNFKPSEPDYSLEDEEHRNQMKMEFGLKFDNEDFYGYPNFDDLFN
jgi:hypothetical protein